MKFNLNYTKKIIAVALLSLVVFSCSSERDEQFCACLEASEALNKASSSLMKSTEMDMNKSTELRELREKKEQECKNYSELTAEESKSLRAACEDQ